MSILEQNIDNETSYVTSRATRANFEKALNNFFSDDDDDDDDER